MKFVIEDVSQNSKKALKIAQSGIDQVLPEKAIEKNVSFRKNTLLVGKKLFPINSRLFVIGAGKASSLMAQSLEQIIPKEKITGGIVNSNISTKTNIIKIHSAGHPIPNQSGLKGAREVLELTENLQETDAVIFLLSGGGSALFTLPIDDVSLKDLQLLTEIMIKRGVEVYEMQKVRKHLSQVKGGRLAKHLFPAEVISLVVSDLVNPHDVVASGPLEPDPSTFEEALDVIEKYDLVSQVPKSIITALQAGAAQKKEETPKPGNQIFEKVNTFVLADNHTALKQMAKTAQSLGFRPIIRPEPLLGEMQKASKQIATEISDLSKNNQQPIAYLYSSELVVSVQGEGKGGRCQEHSARVAEILGDSCCYTFLSIGSDGADYLDGVGGAVVNQDTFQKWQDQQVDVSRRLGNNDSYSLHQASKTLIKGAKTGTNVGDLQVCLLEK